MPDSSEYPVARIYYPGGECLLRPEQNVKVGRSGESDFVLPDPKVSRSHALLEWNGSGFVIRDLGSANGTFVNGQRVQNGTQLLKDGDKITLHKLELTYEVLPPPQPPEQEVLPAQDIEKTMVGYESVQRKAGAHLSVSAGPDVGSDYPLTADKVTIGRFSRDATWDIRLSDRSVSRPHAAIERSGSSYIVRDLSSANGTSVNDQPVSDSVVLKPGDVITIGETRLVFHL